MFFEFMNSIETSCKVTFTISIFNKGSVLEALDFSLYINEYNKVCIDVYAKPTNGFTYVLPLTCYPKNSINKVPKGILLRLRRICDLLTSPSVFPQAQVDSHSMVSKCKSKRCDICQN